MSKIHVLSKEVAELIAAGEVIDRPSSVVKELLENAIDSGASVITAEIKNGGRSYIRITDNGCGIAAEDVPTAFIRHATSKIAEKTDLDRILTLGFRGEALASIAAVSRTEVITKRRADDLGTRCVVEGTEQTVCEQCGCPDGTTFVVRDLFFNVPARLKFLKKDVTEGNAIAGIISKLALSHPEISFKFIRDNKNELLTGGDGKLYSAIYSVFGREFAKALIPVDYRSEKVRVTGYICKPLAGRANRSFQNFFINGRYVRSVTCMVSLEEAYRNSMMTGKFPACVLRLTLPPDRIDVNVHPTKIDVRFTDEKLIYDCVYFAVKNAILADTVPAELNVPAERSFLSEQNTQSERNVREKTQISANEEVSPQRIVPEQISSAPKVLPELEIPQKHYTARELRGHSGLEMPAEPAGEQLSFPEQVSLPKAEKPDVSEFQYIRSAALERREQPAAPVIQPDETPSVKPVVVGELFRTYVVVEAGEDMFLMDKHAAHERVIFERLQEQETELSPQMLLEPVPVMLTFEEYDAVARNVSALEELGFAVECDVAPTVAVVGIPSLLTDLNPAEVLPELAQGLIHHKHGQKLDLIGDFLHTMACKAAIKAHDVNSRDELQALVDAVFPMDNIRYCPHGRPVMIRLSRREIEKQFKRIV